MSSNRVFTRSRKKNIKKEEEEKTLPVVKKKSRGPIYVNNTVQTLKLNCTIVAVNMQKQHFEPHYDAFVNFMYLTLGRHFYRSFFLKYPHIDLAQPRRTLLFLEYATAEDAKIALGNNGLRFNEDVDAAPLELRMAEEKDTEDFFMVMPWNPMMLNPHLNDVL
jgi:hypothetical protein